MLRMNKTFSFSIFALLAVLVLSPFTSHAYGTSEQTAVRLSDTHVLFTITYKLGFLNRDSSLPTLANTGLDRDISFVITNQDNNQIATNVGSIVLADSAKLQNKRYFLPEGKNSDFTLVAVAEIPANDTDTTHQLKITNLPFITIDDANVAKLGQVDDNTLTEFQTPFVQ